jgi:peptidoglycan hydrolase-like protein with peptidoglycan-binding domain
MDENLGLAKIQFVLDHSEELGGTNPGQEAVDSAIQEKFEQRMDEYIQDTTNIPHGNESAIEALQTYLDVEPTGELNYETISAIDARQQNFDNSGDAQAPQTEPDDPATGDQPLQPETKPDDIGTQVDTSGLSDTQIARVYELRDLIQDHGVGALNNEQVRDIQEVLVDSGLHVSSGGGVDGLYGDMTHNAIQQFVDATKRPDPGNNVRQDVPTQEAPAQEASAPGINAIALSKIHSLQDHINSGNWDHLETEEGRELIMDAQQALLNAGYDIGAPQPDGMVGPSTTNSVQDVVAITTAPRQEADQEQPSAEEIAASVIEEYGGGTPDTDNANAGQPEHDSHTGGPDHAGVGEKANGVQASDIATHGNVEVDLSWEMPEFVQTGWSIGLGEGFGETANPDASQIGPPTQLVPDDLHTDHHADNTANAENTSDVVKTPAQDFGLM